MGYDNGKPVGIAQVNPYITGAYCTTWDPVTHQMLKVRII